MKKPVDYDKRLKTRCFLNQWKKQKEANCIAIGGMIAAGKSTLVNALSEKYGFEPVYELSNNKDDLMYILLQKMYEREEKVAESVCQLQFILNRYERYKEGNTANTNIVKIFDRSIFEDRLFAFHNLLDQPSVFEYYERLWREKVNELVYNVGTPKLYVILDIEWDLFVKRLYERSRDIEINNFEKNKLYFQLLNQSYSQYLKNICDAYRIPYLVVDASKPLTEKMNIIMNKLKTLNIHNS